MTMTSFPGFDARRRAARAPALLLLAGSLAFLPSQPVGAQEAPPAGAFVGTWEGILDAGAVKLRLVFHVTAGADGALAGTMDSPDQGASGIPASSVTVEGGTLRFALAPLGAMYEATLSEDRGTLEGAFSQGGARLPLTLTRGGGGAP